MCHDPALFDPDQRSGRIMRSFRIIIRTITTQQSQILAIKLEPFAMQNGHRDEGAVIAGREQFSHGDLGQTGCNDAKA